LPSFFYLGCFKHSLKFGEKILVLAQLFFIPSEIQEGKNRGNKYQTQVENAQKRIEEICSTFGAV
jgi:hypothetical protein